MFSERDKSYCADIVSHCNYAISYASGMTLEEFKVETKTIHAVERCINIIGEAANKVSDEAIESAPEVPWHQIKGLRNRIVHDYSMVNLDIIWVIVSDDLPDLAATCSSLVAPSDTE